MALLSSCPSAMVDFPSAGPDIQSALDQHYQRPTYLPFRRISLPSAPNLQHRQSIVSTASFDSLPEEGHGGVPATPVVIKNAVRTSKPRPPSVDGARRVRRKESRMVDEQREAKRRKVIAEFYETERSYLDGLELIHSPLLTPTELSSIFSNFIDIWNLHRSFYQSLTAFLNTSASARLHDPPPPLSPVLLAHFPYLSLYTPFVSSFSDALASYAALLRNNSAFSSFIAVQEADPRCGKLKFRDWLLTIVQRCPRYLLLLKDMISCTDAEDPEYASLIAVHTLVSKITMSLNTSLHTHAQTLSLLALQRNTVNLPFQLISPGRTFLKRASLLQLEGSSPREREFLLFSDCLIWLASADGDIFSDKWNALTSPSSSAGSSTPDLRSRTRSDTDHDVLRKRQSLLQLKLNGSPRRKRQASSGVDDRWVYKGHVELVDLEVVVSTPAMGDSPERGFELLSPHQSFAVYAVNDEERDEWVTAIRNAKSSLLVSLSVMQLNSTLTSSASTTHLRRTLQALPYAPEDSSNPKRGKVEHFVPAVWVPDGKTESCMRCGRTFGWRRRRHHCRLCGRCVCGGCSGKVSCCECASLMRRLCSILLARHSSSSTRTRRTTSLRVRAKRATTPSSLCSSSPRNHEPSSPSRAAVRLRPTQRPKSYIQILEEFQEHEASPAASPRASRFSERERSTMDETHGVLDERDEDALTLALALADNDNDNDAGQDVDVLGPEPESLPSTPRKENTARRHKRFSLPAIALQTSPVTARPNADAKARRFSLVLGKGAGPGEGLGLGQGQGQGQLPQSPTRSRALRHSVAAGRLSELLGRGKD
ncbi:hypothetical protein C8Q80DRAFT_1127112 [Daedaleopsis nitida]|nr:hypothetical protein C8Q80DRAFT_1127112 [Daedaleopsis nitida]